jgi:hypothetical protein
VEIDRRFKDHPPPYDAGVLTGGTDPTRSGYGTREMKYTLIAASRTDQFAFEHTSGLKTYGALTWYLAQELLKPSPVRRTYRDVMDRIVMLVRSEQPDQTPQLEGTDFDRVVFGAETVPVQQYFLAEKTDPDKVRIAAGTVHGATTGSQYDIYSPEAHTAASPQKPLTRVILRTVEPFTSTGTMSPQVEIPPAARAIETRHNFEAQQTNVRYEQLPLSPALQQIKKRLEIHADGPFQTVAEAQPFQIRLVEDKGLVSIFGPDGLQLTSAVRTTDPAMLDQVERTMLQWARWFGVLRLSNAASTLDVEFRLTPKTAEARNMAMPAFTPGTGRFDLTVFNRSRRRIFVYILDLTSVGDSSLVYPPDNGQAPVEPGQTLSLPEDRVELPAASPMFVRDILKLIATTSPVDLSCLNHTLQPASVRAPAPVTPDPLSRLLLQSTTGTRNAALPAPVDWTTANVAFEACPQLNGYEHCSQPEH